jgi:hypothetical protein
MFSTCLFCHRDLGVNDAVEAFPIGRRLAFDAAKGRLWVICRRCARWNLSPIEERWEVIEECERLFRDTRLRVSTDNVGMARVPDGTELVRIGAPQRPELAAWRYGDQFGRRHRRNLIYTSATIAVTIPLVATGAYGALAAAIPGGGLILQTAAWLEIYRARHGVVAGTTTGSGEKVLIRGKHLRKARLLPGDGSDGDDGWSLEIAHEAGTSRLHGGDAIRLAARLLARINKVGGGTKSVRRAVERLDHEGGSERLFERIAARPLKEASGLAQWWSGMGAGTHNDPTGTLRSLAIPDRLALEMATHEESERRALEGEIRALEAAWKEAEEIAAIADSLALPPRVEEFLRRHKRG